MKKEFVILVDERGKRKGIEEKILAHEKGLLHRAFSIFLFNEKGEMLLQKRSKNKYHFAGKWTNACCGHPRPAENILSASKRRLNEELGITPKLHKQGSVLYSFYDRHSKLAEHEYDWVFTGKFTGEIFYSRNEVDVIEWITIKQLRKEVKENLERFTPWFTYILSLPEVIATFPYKE